MNQIGFDFEVDQIANLASRSRFLSKIVYENLRSDHVPGKAVQLTESGQDQVPSPQGPPPPPLSVVVIAELGVTLG